MSSSVAFGIYFFVMLAFRSVSSWTIDLPEARKYFFEKNGIYDNDEKKVYPDRETYFYSNIEGNSLHNAKNVEKYASQYEYQSFMEKKVHGVVVNGSRYLEGLRRAIEQYINSLETCNTINFSMNGSSPFSNMSSWRPQMEPPMPQNLTSNFTGNFIGNSTVCERATRVSEHVRRIAQLAGWATRELQEKTYTRKHKDSGESEKALILKLAWFLDRLAHLTGYVPNAEAFVPSTTARPTTIPPVPLSLLSVPDEVKTNMMECLKRNSSEPATVRCAYPVPLPDMFKELFNITDPPPDTSNLDPSETVLPASEPLPQPSTLVEIMNVNSRIQPSNSLQHSQVVKSVQKRSIKDDPMLNLMKYYVKHKVWINSNPVADDQNNMEESKIYPFHIDNYMIKPKSKRSIDIPKFKDPENPMQDISSYVKHKSGINYVKDKTQAEEIQSFLDKIRTRNNINEKYQNFNKRQKKIEKRSTFYEKNLIYPRISENPQQDISFYIKNKEGTNNNPSLEQTVQVRLGLEQVFQTGNIEVVRRFGSNYNPLIPAPLADGIIRSTLDI